jgi:tRNA pseudouridine38-40 synthase
VRTIKLTVAYDGTEFVGWQRQGRGISVQGLIEEALSAIDGAPVTLHGAGRTDSGVHALGQVATARVTSPIGDTRLARALNDLIP